jgi:hypothetical protein
MPERGNFPILPIFAVFAPIYSSSAKRWPNVGTERLKTPRQSETKGTVIRIERQKVK